MRANPGEHCYYCGRLRHQGRCGAWYRAHPEFTYTPTHIKRERAEATNPTLIVQQRSRKWHKEARKTLDGLCEAFVNGEEIEPFTKKLRDMLDRRER